MDYVYVLDQWGTPLMPTRRYGWARRAFKFAQVGSVLAEIVVAIARNETSK